MGLRFVVGLVWDGLQPSDGSGSPKTVPVKTLQAFARDSLGPESPPVKTVGSDIIWIIIM